MKVEKEFEYKILDLMFRDPTYVERELNKLGHQGWELVTNKGDYEYIFKREINKKEDLV